MNNYKILILVKYFLSKKIFGRLIIGYIICAIILPIHTFAQVKLDSNGTNLLANGNYAFQITDTLQNIVETYPVDLDSYYWLRCENNIQMPNEKFNEKNGLDEKLTSFLSNVNGLLRAINKIMKQDRKSEHKSDLSNMVNSLEEMLGSVEQVTNKIIVDSNFKESSCFTKIMNKDSK